MGSIPGKARIDPQGGLPFTARRASIVARSREIGAKADIHRVALVSTGRLYDDRPRSNFVTPHPPPMPCQLPRPGSAPLSPYPDRRMKAGAGMDRKVQAKGLGRLGIKRGCP